MSAPLPDGVRARFKACLEEGLSGRTAAARLKLSLGDGNTMGPSDPSARDGRAGAARSRGRGKLAPHQAFLEELVAQDPDITLEPSCAMPWPWPKA